MKCDEVQAPRQLVGDVRGQVVLIKGRVDRRQDLPDLFGRRLQDDAGAVDLDEELDYLF